MKLLFLHGWPGTGKLTVAREIADLTGFKVFHNHLTVDLVEAVFEFGSDPFIDLREQIWVETFRRAARSGLAGLIFTFVFEKTVRDRFLPDAVGAVESSGGEVLFVELRCRMSELEKRLIDPSRRHFGKLQSAEQLKALLDAGTILLTPALPRPNFVLDTTALTAPDAARVIVQHFNL